MRSGLMTDREKLEAIGAILRESHGCGHTEECDCPGLIRRALRVIGAPHTAVEQGPRCPKCKGPMARRQNRRNGNMFLGCRKYPACDGTRKLSEPPDLPDPDPFNDGGDRFENIDDNGWPF